jgi:hypothetical protein
MAIPWGGGNNAMAWYSGSYIAEPATDNAKTAAETLLSSLPPQFLNVNLSLFVPGPANSPEKTRLQNRLPLG